MTPRLAQRAVLAAARRLTAAAGEALSGAAPRGLVRRGACGAGGTGATNAQTPSMPYSGAPAAAAARLEAARGAAGRSGGIYLPLVAGGGALAGRAGGIGAQGAPCAARGMCLAAQPSASPAQGAGVEAPSAPSLRLVNFGSKPGRAKRRAAMEAARHPRRRAKRMERPQAAAVRDWSLAEVGSAPLDKVRGPACAPWVRIGSHLWADNFPWLGSRRIWSHLWADNFPWLGSRRGVEARGTTWSRDALAVRYTLQGVRIGSAALLIGHGANSTQRDESIALKCGTNSAKASIVRASSAPIASIARTYSIARDLTRAHTLLALGPLRLVFPLQRVWGRPLMVDVVHNVVKWQLAKRRAGTASVKKYWELRRTKRKPHAQKGTGRARQGDYRGPHMRGGITMFGPRPKDWSYPLPRKMRRLGVQVALSERRREGRLLVVDSLDPPEAKTRAANDFLARVGGSKMLLIDGVLPEGAKGTGRACEHCAKGAKDADPSEAALGIHEQLERDGDVFYDASTGRWAGELPEPSPGLLMATRNVPYMSVLPPQGVNVYDVVMNDTIVVSTDALRYMQVRLTRPIKRRPSTLYGGKLGSAEEPVVDGSAEAPVVDGSAEEPVVDEDKEAADSLSREEVEALGVVALKGELRKQGLKVSGAKAALVARLLGEPEP